MTFLNTHEPSSVCVCVMWGLGQFKKSQCGPGTPEGRTPLSYDYRSLIRTSFLSGPHNQASNPVKEQETNHSHALLAPHCTRPMMPWTWTEHSRKK